MQNYEIHKKILKFKINQLRTRYTTTSLAEFCINRGTKCYALKHQTEFYDKLTTDRLA